MPLPRRSNNSIEDYKEIWSTNNDYIKKVGRKRFDVIRKTLIENHNVKLLVSYDSKFSNMIIHHFPTMLVHSWVDSKNKRFELRKLNIENDRIVYLLKTPFFGQGQISYEGLENAAKTIKEMGIHI